MKKLIISSIILFPMVFSFLSFRSICLAATPVIFYSDLISGPKTGGQDNKGAFVTTWGKNFGSTRGSSYVSIGGGQADNYPTWSNTKICFQLGSNAATGNIVVTVGGMSSNGVSFTVRAGNIYFVTPDGTGDGSYASPFAPSDFIDKIDSGDGNEDGATCYFRVGTYADQYAYPNWHSNFCFLSNHSGASGQENAFIAYPGETATLNAVSGGADRNNFRTHDTSLATYITVSQFVCNAINNCITASSNWRVIGNYCDGISVLTAAGVIGAKGDNIKIYGNEITGGSSGNKLDHAFYPNEGSNIYFGWNYIHDNNFAQGPMISINHDTAWTNNWQFLNYHIHDNIIDVSAYPSRAMGVYETGPDSTIYYYNNVIIGNPGSSLNSIFAASAHVYYYNNSLYNVGDTLSPVFAFYGVDIHSHYYFPLSITLRNNIIHANSNSPYYVRVTNPAPLPVQDYNCYYGIGAYAQAGGGGADANAINNQDPRYSDPANGDLSLRSDSPCIGAGSSTVSSVVTKDIDGVSRPQTDATTGDTGYDIGAYEYIVYPAKNLKIQ